VRHILEAGTSIVMVGVALIMLGFYLLDRRDNRAGRPGVLVEDWQEYNEAGIRLGPADAPIVITEFMDFTCPHCRSVGPVTDSLHRAFPEDVAIVFHHFPLSGRPFAMELAVATECAREQNQFWAMARAIFAASQAPSRDDLRVLASSIGLPDSQAFEECLNRPQDSFDQVFHGRQIGSETGVAGTPTIWMNGEIETARSFNGFLQAAEKHGVDLRQD